MIGATNEDLGITDEDLAMLKKYGFADMHELAQFMSSEHEGPDELIQYFTNRLPALEQAAAAYVLRKALRR